MSSDDENFGGYYNSVGSKEGWAPQSFRSSRKSRAQVKQQSISDFLDEDEKQDLDEKQLKQEIFDSFGFTATELARKRADQKEQKQRPDELIIVPVVVTESPRVRSKLDALLFMPDSTPPQMHRGTETTDEVEIQNEEVAVENVERPAVDLYKAIFSDDEEEENIMTTSGDLLESLGKEIGLVVPPPEMPPPDNNKPFAKIAPKETFHFEKENMETSATNGETPRQKDIQQIDSSKFRKNRDDRSRKRLGSRRRKSSSSESDADSSDDSRRKEKRTSREKSSSKRRAKSHKHTRKDSSPSRSNLRKEHENRKRKRR